MTVDPRERQALETLAYGPNTPDDVRYRALADLRSLNLRDEGRWDFNDELVADRVRRVGGPQRVLTSQLLDAGAARS